MGEARCITHPTAGAQHVVGDLDRLRHQRLGEPGGIGQITRVFGLEAVHDVAVAANAALPTFPDIGIGCARRV